MNKKNKKNKGFSLVELIIVIAIMAILAGVMVPQFIKYINESKKSADIQQAQVIYDAVMTAYADDAVNNTTNVTVSATPTEIDNDAADKLKISSTAPKSKIKSGKPFAYTCEVNDDNGTVTVKVYVKDGDTTYEVSPNPDTDWQSK